MSIIFKLYLAVVFGCFIMSTLMYIRVFCSRKEYEQRPSRRYLDKITSYKDRADTLLCYSIIAVAIFLLFGLLHWGWEFPMQKSQYVVQEHQISSGDEFLQVGADAYNQSAEVWRNQGVSYTKYMRTYCTCNGVLYCNKGDVALWCDYKDVPENWKWAHGNYLCGTLNIPVPK